MLREDVCILVVDDVNTMLTQVRSLLHSFGFKNIKLASSSEEAISILKAEAIHLVLSDWHMAPMNGLDFLKLVRKTEQFKTIPFIMVTAENTKEMVVQAIQSGVDDYLVKPLTIEQVQNKVYGVLLKKQVL
jgi:two-component system, chemotaxis family, chemotaxis protein CheY